MNAIVINKEKIILEITQEELGILSNTLNEVCNGIEIWEFDTRIGATIENARTLLDSLISVYVKAD